MAAPIFGYNQSFETNTSGFATSFGGTIVTATGGTTAVPGAAEGSTYAVLTEGAPSPESTPAGPFTNFGAYRTEFVDGLRAEAKVYLGDWALNEGFQYTVAANGTNNAHQRDFGFQVRALGEETYEISVSLGATRDPVTVTLPGAKVLTGEGWYTFEHVFRNDEGVLSVDLSVRDDQGVVTVIGTLSNPEDTIPAEVGGNRYGWFTDISVPAPGLAVDAFKLGDYQASLVEALEGTGESETVYTSSGVIPFFDADGSLPGYAVEASDNGTDYLGEFTAAFGASSTPLDGQGTVVWSFNATNGELDGLAEGEELVQTYTLTLTDGETPVTQTVSVTIVGTNDAPIITGGATATYNVAENTTAVATIVATDVDTNDAIAYSITGGDDASRFVINSETGALSFASAPNFEAPADVGGDNVYNVIVTASDGIATDTQAIAVTVTDVNDNSPVFAGADPLPVNFAENGTGVVTTVAATDADANAMIAYSISGGADEARFSINATTGALSFVNAPDFENPADASDDNIYDVIVTASDGTNTDTQTIAVTVTDVNDNSPVFAGADPLPVNFAENGTGVVTTVAATDADANAMIAYSISGGADEARFSINATTGALSFVNAPDFENPADAGRNNIYDVIVTASDGTNADTQAIAVTVTDVNEGGTPPVTPPVSTTPTTGPDNITGTPGQDNVIAAGAGNDTVSAGSGNDSVFGNQDNDQLFGNQGNDTIFGGQGADSVYGGQDNDSVSGNMGNDIVYGNLGDDQVFGNEGDDQVFGNEGNDFVHGGQGNDSVYGGQGNDVLNGGAGNDLLQGGVGSDRFVFDSAQGADVITDFRFGEGDRIDLRGQDYVLGQNNEGQATLFLEGGGTVVLLGLTPDQFQSDFVIA